MSAAGGVPPRYRCTACGNLTRFDVVEARRTRSFFHYTIGGDLAVDETEVIEHTVEAVTCRWCGGTGAAIDDLGTPSQVTG